MLFIFFFFSSRRRHTRYWRDWSSDVCSSDLLLGDGPVLAGLLQPGDQLAELELLPGAVPLDDQEGRLLDPFEGGEASTTDRTGPPTADRPPILGRAGVDYAVLIGPAERATHG